jgi:magnesium chelatase family protein
VPERYAGRISGPLRDRIDLWVEMSRVPPAELVAASRPETSAVVAERIVEAKRRQGIRNISNGRASGRRLLAMAAMRPAAEHTLVALSDLEVLSARGTERLLRVARTIADLAASDRVEAAHLEEAARFRAPARRLADNRASA